MDCREWELGSAVQSGKLGLCLPAGGCRFTDAGVGLGLFSSREGAVLAEALV